MRLDLILSKVGGSIAKAEKSDDGRVILFVRTGTSDIQLERWRSSIEGLILDCASRSKGRWGVDVSKAFFAADGNVRYLWRLVFTGDVRTGTEAFGNSVMRSLSIGGEVTSMPLVGQVKYEFDPANGKMKGGHDPKTAARVIAYGISGGKIQ